MTGLVPDKIGGMVSGIGFACYCSRVVDCAAAGFVGHQDGLMVTALVLCFFVSVTGSEWSVELDGFGGALGTPDYTGGLRVPQRRTLWCSLEA